MISATNTFDPDYAVPPGETLLETLESCGLSQTELALRMGRPKKTINEIIQGVAAITADTAIQLEKVTGVPASFWNNAEANYRERLARIKEHEALEAQEAWLSAFSYNEMVKLGFVKKLDGVVARVNQLLGFFAVASSKQWESQYGEGVLEGSARAANGYENKAGDLSVWLRGGEILAQRCETAPYDEAKFKEALKKIRSLTRGSPSMVWEQVRELCAGAGVAVVLVPELPQIHVNGFTRWLTPQKAVIQLSLRHKRDDIMWFTFFHEAAHILLHSKKERFIERKGAKNPLEAEADQWAANFLIPEREWTLFVSKVGRHACITDITAFADSAGVAPSIVHGRLQRDGLVPRSRFNHLRTHVEIVWKGLA